MKDKAHVNGVLLKAYGTEFGVASFVFEDREISELVWDVFDLIHSYDWYASGDTCKETYLKGKAEFKKEMVFQSWSESPSHCRRCSQ